MESEKEIQALKDKNNFETERSRTHVYVPNPYDSDTGLALRSSQGERLLALGVRGARGSRRESRSPGKRSSQSKSPRRKRTTGGSQVPGSGIYGKDAKSPGRDRKDPGRGRVNTISIMEVAAESVSSSEVEVEEEVEVEAAVRSNTVPASAFTSSYIDDVKGTGLLGEKGDGGGEGAGFRGLEGGGGGGFGGLEEHTPNVVRRARLREQQQQQQQLQQRITDQLNISTQPRPNPTSNTANAINPSSRTPGTEDKGGVDYSPDAYYALYALMNTTMNPIKDPSYLHSSLYEGVGVGVTSPDALSTPAPYPRRALYAQAPAPVVRNLLQERERERYGKDRPAMSDDAVANIIQAAQMRRSQRAEQNLSHPVPVPVFVPVTTRTASQPISTGSIVTGNIPASLESSVADLADIMYALGAAKSSMKTDRPCRRGQRDIGMDYPFSMEGLGSGSVSGSDLHSVRSTSTDGPQPHI